MPGLPKVGPTVLALALTCAAAAAEGPQFSECPACKACTPEKAAASPQCKVISLADLGDNTLAEWVAVTIPRVVRRETWNGPFAAVEYYPPARLLVVTHTPDVHAEIEAFIKNVRQSRPATGTPAPTGVVRAHHETPAPLPVAAESKKAATKPHHLFEIMVDGLVVRPESAEGIQLKNFTLRYQGDGLIDANIVELFKGSGMSSLAGIGVQSWNADQGQTLPSALMPAGCGMPPPLPASAPTVLPVTGFGPLPMMIPPGALAAPPAPKAPASKAKSN